MEYGEYIIGMLREEGILESEWEKQDERGRTLVRLPKSEIKLESVTIDGRPRVLASLYAVKAEDGYWANWETFSPSDLPNDLISLDDLKRFGIDTVNVKPGGGEE